LAFLVFPAAVGVVIGGVVHLFCFVHKCPLVWCFEGVSLYIL
jgi:hypothetical protein